LGSLTLTQAENKKQDKESLLRFSASEKQSLG